MNWEATHSEIASESDSGEFSVGGDYYSISIQKGPPESVCYTDGKLSIRVKVYLEFVP